MDKASTDTNLWQEVLIDMLRVARKIKVQNTDNANVEKQNRHLLDIYFEWYLNEVKALNSWRAYQTILSANSQCKSIKRKTGICRTPQQKCSS
ncbi:hypothetical protein QW060_20075 [Myroides ceti]|uniref:Uncharacterized protein n=1 Tax=Paenimyroides ceti TaxID=395087 RepID=A0ABT8D0D9_9FLAO|nr:hypothetical protein [Paenimyroides ceti]MDN3709317.1 hypothetical protein [Paenimyroides ceti]